MHGFAIDTIQRTQAVRMGDGWALYCAAALADFRRLLSYYSEGYPTGETADDLLLRLPIGNVRRPHLETVADRLQSYRDVAATKETKKDTTDSEWPANLRELVLGLSFVSLREKPEAPPAMDAATQATVADYWRTAAALSNRLGGAVFCGTEKRYVGLVQGAARAGDRTCLLRGAKVPFVLRPVHVAKGVYRLIGEAYVHGIMHGQAAGQGPKDERFILS